jgi:exopolysaccharide production protein ExoZ
MKSNRLDSIQFLRFAAAFSVLVYHIPRLHFGSWGVDVFFIISGFVIAYSANKSTDFFFTKRLVRVIPIYWLLTIAVFAIAWYSPSLLTHTSPNFYYLTKSLLFIPFDKNALELRPILVVGWTLNYEMIFYTIFAISLKVTKNKYIYVSSIAITLLHLTAHSLPKELPIVRFLSDSIILEFVFGMIVFQLWKHWNEKNIQLSKSSSSLVAIAVAILILLSLMLNTQIRAIDLGLPSFLVVILALHLGPLIKIPRLFLLLGDSSYSLYLTHLFVIQLADKFLNAFDKVGFAFWSSTVIVIVLCMFLSICSYKFIELPISYFLRAKIISNKAHG